MFRASVKYIRTRFTIVYFCVLPGIGHRRFAYELVRYYIESKYSTDRKLDG